MAGLYAATIDGLMGIIALGSDIYGRDRMMSALEERFINFGRQRDD